MRQTSSVSLLLILLASFVLVTPASADVIWGTTQHVPPSTPPGEQAVQLTPGVVGTAMGGNVFTMSAVTSGGAPVTLTTNNFGSTGVDHLYSFSSSELRSNPATDDDTSIDELTITLPGNEFGDIYFNIFGAFSENHAGLPNTTVSFAVTTNDGTFTHVFTGLTDNNTDNWIFLTTTAGETMQSVTISDARFFALQDTHVSEVAATSVPEPATLMLVVSGLGGFLLRRRKK